MATAAADGVDGRTAAAPRPQRAARRASIAIATVAVVVAAFAFVMARPLQPAGDVEGLVGTPATGTTGSPGDGPSPIPGGLTVTPSGSPVGGSPAPSAARTATGTPSQSSGLAAPTPLATPAPTPRPIPTPGATPRPTPRPTPKPKPTPTPCMLAAPQLAGQHRNSAASLWSDAGFTGSVTTLPGNGNYVIGSQDRVAGTQYPCTASVTVGP
jgi:hypothetical protein